MLGDTQAQNGQGRDGESPKGSMHRAKEVRGKQWSTKRGEAGKAALGLETLHPAQISSRLLCSGLPSGAFSGGAGEAEGRGV